MYLCNSLPDLFSYMHMFIDNWLTSQHYIGADFRFEVPGQSSVGLVCGGRGQWLGGIMASAEHEPMMEVWGQSPQRGPGAEPLVRGAKPPKAESILVIGCPMEPANLAPLVRFSK